VSGRSCCWIEGHAVTLTSQELDRSASETLPVLAIVVVATEFAGDDARTEAHSCGRTRERVAALRRSPATRPGFGYGPPRAGGGCSRRRPDFRAHVPLADQGPRVGSATSCNLAGSGTEASDVNNVSALFRHALGWPDRLRTRGTHQVGSPRRDKASKPLAAPFAAHVCDQIIGPKDDVLPAPDGLITERARRLAHGAEPTPNSNDLSTP